MDPRDRAILKAVQREFPIEARPYDALERALGIPAAEIRRRLAALKKRGVVRRVAPVLDRARLGLRGVLIAAKVAPSAVRRAAKCLAARDEVTHNYVRTGPFNLWFTASLRRGESPRALVGELLALEGVRQIVVLPTRRLYKLDASFDAGGPDRG